MPPLVAVRPSPPTNANGILLRKRRAHRKSRKGCGNCKIRRVKCDESKPGCKKCAVFGVSCNYDPKAADLQPLSLSGGGYGSSFDVGVMQLSTPSSSSSSSSSPSSSSPSSPSPSPPTLTLPAPPILKPISLNQTILSMINVGQARSISTSTIPAYQNGYRYQVQEYDLELLGRFQTRTIESIGTARTVDTYRDQIIRLAFQHPFLLHMVLTLTLMHDRFLTPLTTSTSTSPSTNKQSPTEAFHWYAATTLFNSILLHTHPPHHHPTAPTTTTPLHPSERDAIWACAILLGAISFSFIEARTPEQAWPLKPSSPADLDWLRISDGKREVWRMTEPERPDSVWRELGEVYRRHAEEEEEREEEGWIGVGVGGDGLQDVPEEVVEVYDLAMGYTASSSQSGTLTKPKNPYATAASVLLSLFTTPTTTPTTPSPSPTTPQNAKPPAIPKFITFITRLDPTYKHLLELKDPLALLLLAYWYAKVCECECARRWWVEARSRLECRAICMYLEKREGGGVDTRIDDDTMKRLLRWPRRVCEGFVS